MFDLAKAFGKSSMFGLGLVLLGPVFLMILGFGSAQYQLGSAASQAAVPSAPEPQLPQAPADPLMPNGTDGMNQPQA